MLRLLSVLNVWLVISCGTAFAKDRINVTFINPASSETFWKMTSASMKAACEDLNVELEEIPFRERNHLKMVRVAEDVVRRRTPPDYLIVVNEKAAAVEMIKAADKAGVKVLLIVNNLLDDQLKELEGPRQVCPSWIGTMIPDNISAGHTAGRALIEQALKAGVLAGDGQLHVVGIAGSYGTPASLDRVKGLEQAAAGFPKAVLRQVVNADWSREKAQKVMAGLLKRYPDTGAVWSANDNMAAGAMKAAAESSAIPGRNIFFSGVNWENEALKAVQDGKMVVTVGGHFLIGGWIVVLIHDYHRGKDFAEEGTVSYASG